MVDAQPLEKAVAAVARPSLSTVLYPAEMSVRPGSVAQLRVQIASPPTADAEATATAVLLLDYREQPALKAQPSGAHALDPEQGFQK
jgi:hypothetical protein